MLTFSAIITTYHREWNLIERAIQSAETQTYPVLEILLIDDNDTQSGAPFTEAVLKGIEEHPLVRYLSYDGNHGVSYARNYGISKARGDVIGFLDDDDVWLPEKTEKLIGKMEADPQAGLVFGKGKKQSYNGTDAVPTWSSTIFKERPTYEDMLRADHVGTATNPILRKALLDAEPDLRFLEDGQPAVEDYEFWIRVAKNSRLIGVDEYLFLKYMPEGQHVSGNHSRVVSGYLNIYRQNKEAYDRDARAKKSIMYNIMRRAAMGKKPAALRYGLIWLWQCIRCRFQGEAQ
ncbi:MAG: glycosyltransferase family 2 protein [Lachnospiraceae bacterium]|nr:glycosyltransferase family 2 protein [Lachnospiraceae bacterium]